MLCTLYMSELCKQCTACLTGNSASACYVNIAQHCAMFILRNIPLSFILSAYNHVTDSCWPCSSAPVLLAAPDIPGPNSEPVSTQAYTGGARCLRQHPFVARLQGFLRRHRLECCYQHCTLCFPFFSGRLRI